MSNSENKIVYRTIFGNIATWYDPNDNDAYFRSKFTAEEKREVNDCWSQDDRERTETEIICEKRKKYLEDKYSD